MKRTFQYKLMAAALGMSFLLAGCGSKEEVTDYGSGQSTEASGGKTTEVEGARHGRTLSEQLGGKDLSYQQTFAIGDKNVNMNLAIRVIDGEQELESVGEEFLKNSGGIIWDTETLPSFRAREITEDQVHEAEVVKAVFGDSAKEVRRDICIFEGDAEDVVSACEDAYNLYVLGENASDPERQETVFPAWVDDNAYYLHTYEGQVNGIESQLLVSYRKGMKQKIFTLAPKKWGDVAGASDYQFMTHVRDGELMLPVKDDPNNYQTVDIKEAFPDLTNKAGADTAQLSADVSKYLTEQLQLKLPREGVGDSGKTTAGELLFYPQGELEKEKPTALILDGYTIPIQTGLGNQSVYSENPGPDTVQSNSGVVYVTEKGIVAFDLHIAFDYEERLSDQVAILPFDKAMAAAQEELTKELDLSKAGSGEIKIDSPHLDYYPVKSPDKEGEYTYIPAWVCSIWSGDSNYVGEMIQNAMDGSLIRIAYSE